MGGANWERGRGGAGGSMGGVGMLLLILYIHTSIKNGPGLFFCFSFWRGGG